MVTNLYHYYKPCHYRNAALTEQKILLTSKLASCHEQVAMLNKELELYQKLLHESYQVGRSPGQGGEGLGNTTEKVLQLLEDIRRLRRQLDQSIHKNSVLSETLDIPLSDSSTSPRRVRLCLHAFQTYLNTPGNVSKHRSLIAEYCCW